MRAVIRLINDDALCREDYCYVSDNWESPLWLWNTPGLAAGADSVAMFSEDKGWHVFIPEGYGLMAEVEARYKLQPDGKGKRWLRPTPSQDRIKIAVSFARELAKEGVVKIK